MFLLWSTWKLSLGGTVGKRHNYGWSLKQEIELQNVLGLGGWRGACVMHTLRGDRKLSCSTGNRNRKKILPSRWTAFSVTYCMILHVAKADFKLPFSCPQCVSELLVFWFFLNLSFSVRCRETRHHLVTVDTEVSSDREWSPRWRDAFCSQDDLIFLAAIRNEGYNRANAILQPLVTSCSPSSSMASSGQGPLKLFPKRDRVVY